MLFYCQNATAMVIKFILKGRLKSRDALFLCFGSLREAEFVATLEYKEN